MMALRDLRKAASLTQTQLAERMGTTQSTIALWENETFLPKARDLPLLAHVLGCTITELYDPDYLAQYTPPDDLAG